MATSVNPIVLDKQPLKSLSRSPKFLRHGYNMKGNAAKRKSAVELLQESKAFYVKSEQVLDSKQELKHSEHLQVTSNPSYNALLRHPLRTVHSWDVSSSSSSGGGGGGAVAATSTTTSLTTTVAAAVSTQAPVVSVPATAATTQSTVTRRIEPPLQVQHHRSSSSSSSQIIDSKILAFTLLGSTRSPQSRNHHHHHHHHHHNNHNSHQKSGIGDGNSDTAFIRGRGGASVTRTGSSSSSSNRVSMAASAVGSNILQNHHQQQQVFVNVHSSCSSSVTSSLTKMTTTTTIPPTMSMTTTMITSKPPCSKLPHSPHVRSKTQPEVPCPPVAPRPHEYRRSHSERDNSDDIQMKLRRLLNTDSKENLSSNCNSDYENVYSVHNKNKNNSNNNCGRNLKTAATATAVESWHQQHVPPLMMMMMANGSAVEKEEDEENTFAGKTEAFIKPRHQQEGNYCIHKSMPDLSPMQLERRGRGVGRGEVGDRDLVEETGHGRRRSIADGSNDSLSVKEPKSVDLKPPSWSTSDYVSRSPSSRRRLDVYDSDNDEQQQRHLQTRCLLRSQRLDEDEDSTGAASSGGGGAAVEIVDDLIGFGSIRRRPILRSKSDISHRYSKSGTDLSATGSSPKRNSRCGAELERFFDTIGLDSSVLYVLKTPPSDCSSPVFFASISTGSSSCCCRSRHGGGGGGSDSGGDGNNKGTTTMATISSAAAVTSGVGGPLRDHQLDISGQPSSSTPQNEGNVKDGLSNTDLMHHSPVETSIVERNARVIKWLFNCRKVLGVATTNTTTTNVGSSSSSSTTKKQE